MTDRPQRVSIRPKQIEKLIQLAKKHKLALLEVGAIRIALFEDRPAMAQRSTFERKLSEARNKEGRPLTDRQREDAILFGEVDGMSFDG